MTIAVDLGRKATKQTNKLIILYQLTKFEAASFNSFQDIFKYKFSMAKFAKGNSSRKYNKFCSYFHQVIYL